MKKDSLMRKQEMDHILDKLLYSFEEVTELNITAGRPFQVVQSNELVNVGVQDVTPFQTEIFALNLVRGEAHLIKTLLSKGTCDFIYTLPGKARFIVNLFSKQGSYAILLRKFENRIPEKYLGDMITLLITFPVFQVLDPDTIKYVVSLLKWEKFSEKDVIIRKGDIGRRLFIIISGKVEVLDDDGISVAFFEKGEVFGEMSLLSGDPVGMTVKAIKPATTLYLDGKDFKRILNQYPALQMYFARLLAQRLVKTNIARRKEFAYGIAGKLSEMPPSELFQSLNANQKTGVLTLQLPKGPAHVFFREGAIIRAEYDRKEREKAFYEVLREKRGRFKFTPGISAKDSEADELGDFIGLLMEGLRRLDESAIAQEEPILLQDVVPDPPSEDEIRYSSAGDVILLDEVVSETFPEDEGDEEGNLHEVQMDIVASEFDEPILQMTLSEMEMTVPKTEADEGTLILEEGISEITFPDMEADEETLILEEGISEITFPDMEADEETLILGEGISVKRQEGEMPRKHTEISALDRMPDVVAGFKPHPHSEKSEIKDDDMSDMEDLLVDEDPDVTDDEDFDFSMDDRPEFDTMEFNASSLLDAFSGWSELKENPGKRRAENLSPSFAGEKENPDKRRAENVPPTSPIKNVGDKPFVGEKNPEFDSSESAGTLVYERDSDDVVKSPAEDIEEKVKVPPPSPSQSVEDHPRFCYHHCLRKPF